VNTQISPQIKIVALLGLLLAVAGGGFLLTMKHHSPSIAPPTTPATTVHHVTTPAAAPATKHAAKPAHATRAHAQAAASRHAAKPATRGHLVDSRLPAPLQWQLSQHRIVVVSVYNPHADVDAISVAEAHAGAKQAKVGFLLVNVLDNKVAGLLTGLLPGGGLLPEPGVLIFRAPGTLVYRFDGFEDSAAVAQAAFDAARGPAVAPVADPNAPDTATTP
jgi:hypothetical protein